MAAFGSLLALALFAAAVSATALPASAAGPRVWAATAMDRIGPADRGPGSAAIEIAAARGETEPFQVAVHAGAGGLTNVNVEVSALEGPGGQALDPSAATLYREHFVEIRHRSPAWDPKNRPVRDRWIADALIPFVDPATGRPPAGGRFAAAPFDVKAGMTQPVWVEITVPRDQAPGLYRGSYAVTSDQGDTTGAIELTVWDFTLPLRPSLKTNFGIYNDYGVRGQELLLRHRITPNPVYASAQRRFVRQYGLDEFSLGFWSGADIETCEFRDPPSVAAIRARMRQFPVATDFYNYTADEIDACGPAAYRHIRAWARALHAAGVRQLITMRPNPALYNDGSGRPAVDVWAPLHSEILKTPKSRLRWARDHGELWSYTALVQGEGVPHWEIDFRPADFRTMTGFWAQAADLDGILYWTVDHRRPGQDPWTDIDYTGSGYHFAGEGLMVYPGEGAGTRGPVGSIRLALIRDGIDDYDYVQILEDLGRGAAARAIYRRAAANLRTWSRDPDDYYAVREELAALIEAS